MPRETLKFALCKTRLVVQFQSATLTCYNHTITASERSIFSACDQLPKDFPNVPLFPPGLQQTTTARVPQMGPAHLAASQGTVRYSICSVLSSFHAVLARYTPATRNVFLSPPASFSGRVSCFREMFSRLPGLPSSRMHLTPAEAVLGCSTFLPGLFYRKNAAAIRWGSFPLFPPLLCACKRMYHCPNQKFVPRRETKGPALPRPHHPSPPSRSGMGDVQPKWRGQSVPCFAKLVIQQRVGPPHGATRSGKILARL